LLTYFKQYFLYVTCLGRKHGVLKRLQETSGFQNLLDAGGCTLHIVSNANRIATTDVFPELPELVDDLFVFFRRSEKRTHEFRQVCTNSIVRC
jgi:hypothetical protein